MSAIGVLGSPAKHHLYTQLIAHLDLNDHLEMLSAVRSDKILAQNDAPVNNSKGVFAKLRTLQQQNISLDLYKPYTPSNILI